MLLKINQECVYVAQQANGKKVRIERVEAAVVYAHRSLFLCTHTITQSLDVTLEVDIRIEVCMFTRLGVQHFDGHI